MLRRHESGGGGGGVSGGDGHGKRAESPAERAATWHFWPAQLSAELSSAAKAEVGEHR